MAGDVNGDGYSDVIISASRYDNGQTDEGRVYVAAIDEETRDLLLIQGRPDGEGRIVWETPRIVVPDVNAQWVRGRVIAGADGAPAYGVVYDAGSNGGSGMNRYGAVVLGPSAR